MNAAARWRAEVRTILVVADNPDTQAVILEHAKVKGHSVISAPTPALGLSTFDRTHPDIVITDLFLPEKEGITLVKQIRERRPTCPVVVLTEADHSESTMEGLHADEFDCVRQPIHEEAFAQALERVIHRLTIAVENAPGVEPAWRLLHIYGNARASLSQERETIGRVGPAGDVC